MKDVTNCDKLRLAVNERLTRRSPNEETRYHNMISLQRKYIALWREPRELNHLIT